MKIVKEASREPNYQKDIRYGKIAEDDFENRMVPKMYKKGYEVYDVRLVKAYQNKDIDYIVDTINCGELPDIKEVIKNDDFIKIEVKLDSRCLDTGNLTYELLSHGHSGWCAVTKCNFVYMVLTERDKTNIKKRCWIDMEKWHEYCADRKIKKECQYIAAESICDILCNVEDMEKHGILNWL